MKVQLLQVPALASYLMGSIAMCFDFMLRALPHLLSHWYLTTNRP